MTTPGVFICLEGPDGVGKSTQAALLAEALGARHTFEPGETPLGQQIRQLLLHTDHDIDPRAEALLMAADRAQHVADVIRPTLAAGTHVVCDRYIGSSVAYQGYGRGLDPAQVAAVSHFATEDLAPDVVVLLMADAATLAGRLSQRPDRIERAGTGFRDRVADGYVQQAAADPQRWVVVESSGTAMEVHRKVVDVVCDRLGLAVTTHTPSA